MFIDLSIDDEEDQDEREPTPLNDARMTSEEVKEDDLSDDEEELDIREPISLDDAKMTSEEAKEDDLSDDDEEKPDEREPAPLNDAKMISEEAERDLSMLIDAREKLSEVINESVSLPLVGPNAWNRDDPSYYTANHIQSLSTRFKAIFGNVLYQRYCDPPKMWILLKNLLPIATGATELSRLALEDPGPLPGSKLIAYDTLCYELVAKAKREVVTVVSNEPSTFEFTNEGPYIISSFAALCETVLLSCRQEVERKQTLDLLDKVCKIVSSTIPVASRFIEALKPLELAHPLDISPMERELVKNAKKDLRGPGSRTLRNHIINACSAFVDSCSTGAANVADITDSRNICELWLSNHDPTAKVPFAPYRRGPRKAQSLRTGGQFIDKAVEMIIYRNYESSRSKISLSVIAVVNAVVRLLMDLYDIRCLPQARRPPNSRKKKP